MELIVSSFLAIAFTFIGHLTTVIGHQLGRPTHPARFVTEAPQEPPPPAKRSTLPCTLSAPRLLPA